MGPYHIADKEVFYHAVTFLALSLVGSFIQVVSQARRPDAVVHTADTIYVLEFKLDESAEAALNQIQEKGYAQSFQKIFLHSCLLKLSIPSLNFRIILNKMYSAMNRYLLYISLLFISTSLLAQSRIITAGSSSSEIVCALGHCDDIVVTDRTSQYPEQLQNLPSIGYRNSISAEGIISQMPELVILEEEYVKDALIDQLQSTGIKTVVVAQDRSWESTQERINTIAAVLDKEEAGQELIAQMESELAEVKQLVASNDSQPKVLGVYARGAGAMQVGGPNSAFALIELAGAKNAVPDIDGFKPLNAESLIQANPDYILFFDSGLESVGGVDGALQIPGVAQTTAGKQRQIIAMDGVKLTNWGPRLPEAARELFYLTHPEAHAQGTYRPKK